MPQMLKNEIFFLVTSLVNKNGSNEIFKELSLM